METTPVLIAGAGLGGLAAAVFLGLHGVPAVIAERRSEPSGQPKARGQSPVTMEALRTAGLEDKLRAAAPPGGAGKMIVLAKSMVGPVYHSLSEDMLDFSLFSPAPLSAASQERTERILAARATELGADLRFRNELASFEPDDDGVTALLRDTGTGQQRAVRAQYLIGADGHRAGVRRELGIGTHGRPSDPPAPTMFVEFEADLAAVLGGSAYGFYALKNPALPRGSVTIGTTDHPGRYVLGAGLEPARPDRDVQIKEVITTACGIPGLEIKVLDNAWSSSGTHFTRVADVFQAGRVFLIGDAAHLMPPSGGQGGNTAIMDGYHLAWKLAAVLNGAAGPGLLDSHDPERRPFGDALAEQQYANLARRHARHLLDDTVAKVIDPLTVMFGYVCPAGAFVPDEAGAQTEPGGAAAWFENPFSPSGRPGSRAAHIPLTRDGATLSTRDLFRTRFVILTGAGAWAAEAAQAGQRLGLPLDIHVIGGSGPLADPGGRFPAAYGVTDAGAVLVRPDGIIGWRSPGAGRAAELERALRVILDRDAG
jgi:putative polyketide hydroxylase